MKSLEKQGVSFTLFILVGIFFTIVILGGVFWIGNSNQQRLEAFVSENAKKVTYAAELDKNGAASKHSLEVSMGKLLDTCTSVNEAVEKLKDKMETYCDPISKSDKDKSGCFAEQKNLYAAFRQGRCEMEQ